MKLFNRNQNSNVPEDLEAYTAGKRDWRAWARNAVTVVVIVLLVAGVTWAAVKVYQSVTKDEPATKPADQTAQEKDAKDADEKKKSGTMDSKNTQSTQPAKEPAASSAQTPTTMPKTGDDAVTQPAVLPSTGG